MREKLAAAITFCGGAETVTGANFLIEWPGGPRILVDCGLFQGGKVAEDKNYEPFPYDPRSIDFLLVTHAHLDHIGRIPKLVHDGFRGTIYSTPPTKDMAELSLRDSLGVLQKEIRGTGRALLYDDADVSVAIRCWQTVPYRVRRQVAGRLSFQFRDAGHILGSAMVELNYRNYKVVVTGDLGNSPAPLLGDTELVADASYLVMESVYGDRNHPPLADTRAELEDVIEETMHRGGVLVIPAFSIERTQALLYDIKQMMAFSRIPLVPVFLDSPLAINITSIYQHYIDYLKSDLEFGPDGALFHFPQLKKCLTTDESKAIPSFPGPKIIIAGSGMSNGGRIIHHEKRYLPDHKNTLLLAGYQAAGSLGRALYEGARQVNILGQTVAVRARVATISGYSAHKGADDLLQFVSSSADSLRQVFVTMGEPRASFYLAQRIRDYLGVAASVPKLGQRRVITF